MADAPITTASWTERVKTNSGKSWGEVKNIVGKDVELGARAKGFARVGTVGLGLYIAKDALSSQTVDGEERSALNRMGHLVLGGGIAAAGVLVGHGR